MDPAVPRRAPLLAGTRLRIGVVAALMMAFWLVGPPDQSLAWKTAFDLGHSLFFGVVMWMAADVANDILRNHRLGFRLAAAVLATCCLAGLSEAVQSFQPGRVPSLGDLVRDLAGAVVLLSIRLANLNAPRPRPFARLALRSLAALIGIGILVPVALVWQAYADRTNRFPVLVRFDGSRSERYFIARRNAELWTSPAALAAESLEPGTTMRLHPARFPSVILNEPYPDWTAYRQLVVTVAVGPGVSVSLNVRIHDGKHNQQMADRFDRAFPLAAGVNRIVIDLDEVRQAPRGRELDLRNVDGIVLSVHNLAQPLVLRFGPLYLR